GQPPMSDDKVAQIKRRIETTQLQIQNSQAELAAMQQEVESASITDPVARVARQKEVLAKRAEVNAKGQDAPVQFRKQLLDIQQRLMTSGPAFAALLDKCFKDTSDKYAGSAHQKLIADVPDRNSDRNFRWQRR